MRRGACVHGHKLHRHLSTCAGSCADDSSYGYVCAVEDRQAHVISVFTSAINSVVQIGQSSIMYQHGGAHNIDSTLNTLITTP